MPGKTIRKQWLIKGTGVLKEKTKGTKDKVRTRVPLLPFGALGVIISPIPSTLRRMFTEWPTSSAQFSCAYWLAWSPSPSSPLPFYRSFRTRFTFLPWRWSLHNHRSEYHCMFPRLLLAFVWNIFEETSSSDDDVDRYVIVTEILDCLTMGTTVSIPNTRNLSSIKLPTQDTVNISL
jgi:hypothetical protein